MPTRVDGKLMLGPQTYGLTDRLEASQTCRQQATEFSASRASRVHGLGFEVGKCYKLWPKQQCLLLE